MPSSFAHQLPVYSPLSARALIRAARSVAHPRGEDGERLHKLLRTEYGADDVTLVDCGTSALRLAIEQAGAAEVALPGFCCYDVASAALGTPVAVHLYDLDPATLGPDPESLDRAFRSGARAAVIAPLYGVPVDWEELAQIAAAHDALLIEDAAQGHGASLGGRALGSLAERSILSFGRGKGWSGMRGGALLHRGAAGPAPTVSRPPSTASQWTGILSALAVWTLARPAIYGLPASIPQLALGETRYLPPHPPSALPSSAAAVLLATYDAARDEAATRRETAQWYRERLPARALIQLPASARAGYLRFPVRVRLSRTSAAGWVRLGVAPSYPTTLAELPPLQPRLRALPPLPGATELSRTLFTLPTHSRVTPDGREAIIAALRSA